MRHIKAYVTDSFKEAETNETEKVDLKKAFTMTAGQKKEEEALLKKVGKEFDTLTNMIKSMSTMIGGEFLAPGIQSRAMKVIKEKLDKIK